MVNIILLKYKILMIKWPRPIASFPNIINPLPTYLNAHKFFHNFNMAAT